MTKEFFTKHDTQAVKGLMAIIILSHHIYQRVPAPDATWLDYIFRSLGYLGVSVFLFISGYGITCSYKEGEGYLSLFLRNRVASLYIVNVLLIFLYAIVLLAFNYAVPLEKVFQSFFIGDTIVGAGWYLQIQILFYLMWYFSIKRSEGYVCIKLLVGITIFNLLAYLGDFGIHWVLSNYAFVAGVILGMRKTKFEEILKIYNKTIEWSLILVMLSMFVLCYFFYYRSFVISCMMQIIMSVVFPLSLCLLIFNKALNCSMLIKVSVYSLDIFVLQGIVFIVLRNNYWNVSNLMFVIFSIIGVVLISLAFHPFFYFLINLKKK